MKMKATERMRRVCLMADYATKLVYSKGCEDLNKSDIYQPLLKSTHLSVSYGEFEAISFSTCTRLDKLIDSRVVYITLVEWSEPRTSEKYTWYELKSDIDECDAAISVKRKIRAMIKNANEYSSVGH